MCNALTHCLHDLKQLSVLTGSEAAINATDCILRVVPRHRHCPPSQMGSEVGALNDARVHCIRLRHICSVLTFIHSYAHAPQVFACPQLCRPPKNPSAVQCMLVLSQLKQMPLHILQM